MRNVPPVQSSKPRSSRVLSNTVETAGIEPALRFPREQQVPLPLRESSGAVIAYAVVDDEDRNLLRFRWYLDSDPARQGGKLYAKRNVGRVSIYLHRQIMGLERGDPRVADHINGLTLDNRRANLRIVTHAQNAQNQGVRRTNKSSRYRGVTWDKSRARWMARGMINGHHKTIGRFDDEHEAGAAAASWRREHMPFSRETP